LLCSSHPAGRLAALSTASDRHIVKREYEPHEYEYTMSLLLLLNGFIHLMNSIFCKRQIATMWRQEAKRDSVVLLLLAEATEYEADGGSMI
jgi:hypothetical protein